MELATIKSMILIDDSLTEVIESPEYKSYEVLARHGYKPARKVAPIASGFPLIDVGDISKTLQKLGIDVSEGVLQNLQRWERDRRMDNYDRFQYWNFQEKKPRDKWLITSAVRGNPSNGLPTRISIESSRLSAYNGLIPPPNAQNIAKALDSELFDDVAIWYPQEFQYPDEAIHYDVSAQKESQKMLVDPIAVGIVRTAAEYQETITYFFIDFWPEDIKLGEKARWLLTSK